MAAPKSISLLSAWAGHVRRLAAGRIPGQLVIQWTTHCNARCPQCGMRVDAQVVRRRLPVGDVKRLLDAAAAKGVQAVSLTGGEPLLFESELIELLKHAGRAGIPYIRTGTNGFMFRNAGTAAGMDRVRRLIDRLAETPIRNFWISLDSVVPELHERMRGLPGVIDGIERSLPLFHAAGIYPSANLGINRHVGGEATGELHPDLYGSMENYLQHFYRRFKEAFDRFYRFVHTLGFTIVNTCYPMSIGEAEEKAGLQAVYGATALERLVAFSRAEKVMLYKALLHTIPEHRGRLRIFTPLSALHALSAQHGGIDSQPAFGCRGGVDFFFVSALDGATYPCGYRGGENMGDFCALDVERLSPGSDCRRCDWECFRDPSELCAPFLLAPSAPLRLIRGYVRDPAALRLWVQDLRYYRACRMFDGRRPPEPERLGAFAGGRFVTSVAPGHAAAVAKTD